MKAGCFSAFFSHRSTEGTSEFLPFMPLLYGSVSRRVWFKAGAPTASATCRITTRSSAPKRKFATQASGPLWPASRVCPRASRSRRCVDISPRCRDAHPVGRRSEAPEGVYFEASRRASLMKNQGPVPREIRGQQAFSIGHEDNTGPYLHRWRAGPIL